MKPRTTSDNSSKEVNDNIAYFKDVFKIIEEGRKKIKQSEQLKDKILILGRTTDGKSTLAQWLAGDDTKLKSKAISPGVFTIVDDDDDGKIGVSTLNSKTIIPDLVADSDNAFYDCGGFGDTRNICYDLAVNYLIKTVADYAKRIKIIFVINYQSVRKGGNKGDFMKLIKHVTDLVKDIDKFRNSFAIVITKVDNIPIRIGDEWIFLDDNSVTSAVANFLKESRQELEENMRNNLGEREKCKENALKIIDVLLTKKRKNYTKIKLFRRPEESGPLSKSIAFQNAKKDMLKAFKTLVYVKKDKDDFSYSLSERSRNSVNDMVKEFNEIIRSNFKIIASSVEDHFTNFELIIRKAIESIVAGTEVDNCLHLEPKQLLFEIRKNILVVETMLEKLKNLHNVDETVATVNECIAILKISIPEKITKEITDQVKYLNFLQMFCNVEFSVRPWIDIFYNTLLFLQTLDKNLDEYINETILKVEMDMEEALGDLVTVMRNEYAKKMESVDVQNLCLSLSKEKQIWIAKSETIAQKLMAPDSSKDCDEVNAQSVFEIKSSANISIVKFLSFLSLLSIFLPEFLLSRFSKEDWNTEEEMLTNTETSLKDADEIIENFCNIESSLKVQFPENSFMGIVKLKECLIFLKILSNKRLSIDLTPWLLMMQNIARFLHESECRYKFLNDLYGKFSEYGVQNFKHFYNVKNMEDWMNPGGEKGIEVKADNFNIFLDNISSFFVAESTTMENIQFEELEHDLNHILDLTLRNEISIYFEKTSITIQGDCISVKKSIDNVRFVSLFKYKTVKTLRFFASNTIFIDRDLDFVGKKLSLVMIAPKWEIIGARKIDLSGLKGDNPPFSYYYTNDGAPGKPGGSGGNFLGVGETFINGENLTIFTNGGRGGDGQDGKDGKSGTDEVLNDLNDIVNEGQNLPSWAIAALGVTGIFTFGGAMVGMALYSGIRKVGSLLDEIVLDEGGKGGNGGDGGKGGEGGKPGKLILIELSGSSDVVKKNYKGSAGFDGRGGVGGRSGKDKVLCGDKKEGVVVKLVEGKKPGRRGRSGANSSGRRSPEEAINNIEFDSILKDYDAFLENPLNDRFRKYYLKRFISRLRLHFLILK